MIEKDLIFDLGLYEGQDSRFYLDKGFRVVAVEAHPEYARLARKAFAREINEQRFRLVERAVWIDEDRTITFHMQGAQSSAFKEAADLNGPSTPVECRTTTLNQLIRAHGTPYYLKVDIEGADQIVVDQLHALGRKPPYLSIETDQPRAISDLAALGYSQFQIVNQEYHWTTREPYPAREGSRAGTKLDGNFTGLFGRELDPRFWLSADAAIMELQKRADILRSGWMRKQLYRRYGKATGRRWLVPQGWTDVHARLV
ncbi:MAG: FkbM family methyltransferase [Pseudomonadota bacterium]